MKDTKHTHLGFLWSGWLWALFQLGHRLMNAPPCPLRCWCVIGSDLETRFRIIPVKSFSQWGVVLSSINLLTKVNLCYSLVYSLGSPLDAKCLYIGIKFCQRELLFNLTWVDNFMYFPPQILYSTTLVALFFTELQDPFVRKTVLYIVFSRNITKNLMMGSALAKHLGRIWHHSLFCTCLLENMKCSLTFRGIKILSNFWCGVWRNQAIPGVLVPWLHHLFHLHLEFHIHRKEFCAPEVCWWY